LRNRPEDILALINYYGKKYAVEFDKKWPDAISKDIIDKLCEYHWPGNVRELQNTLRRLIIFEEDMQTIESIFGNIKPKNIIQTNTNIGHPFHPLKQFGLNGEEPDLKSLSLKKIRKKVSDSVERQAISYVLEKTGWNRSRANKILKISYKTLLDKIKEFELTQPDRLN
jgi:DNA-binding NtrC family response regulator